MSRKGKDAATAAAAEEKDPLWSSGTTGERRNDRAAAGGPVKELTAPAIDGGGSQSIKRMTERHRSIFSGKTNSGAPKGRVPPISLLLMGEGALVALGGAALRIAERMEDSSLRNLAGQICPKEMKETNNNQRPSGTYGLTVGHP